MKLNINGKVIEVADDMIKKAIEEKATEISVNTDFVLRTNEEDTLFKENTRKEGISIGAEIGRKEVLKGLGIEGEGIHKSDATSIDTIKTWANGLVDKSMQDAKIEPDKKLQEAQKDLMTLKNTVTELQSQKEKVLNDFTNFKKSQTIQSTLSSLIPDNIIIDKSDMLTILSTKVKVDVDETGNVFALGQDGQPIKNPTTLEVLPVKDVVKGFFDNNPTYLKATQGGASGDDSNPSGTSKQNIDDFIKEMNENKVAPNSPEFNAEMQNRIKSGTLAI